MYRAEKRKSCGSILPNLFCLLQMIVLALSVSIGLQFGQMLNFGVFMFFIAGFISVGFIFYFLLKRKRILQRQIYRCIL